MYFFSVKSSNENYNDSTDVHNNIDRRLKRVEEEKETLYVYMNYRRRVQSTKLYNYYIGRYALNNQTPISHVNSS
jgi:DNA helicase IV